MGSEGILRKKGEYSEEMYHKKKIGQVMTRSKNLLPVLALHL
jgi:hypothetical protein